MSFIDEIKIYIKAGDGGNGAATFRREKFIEFGGPDGGNGGEGGDVICIATRNKNTLLHMRYHQHVLASNGSNGQRRRKFGAKGKDMKIFLPVGTQIFNESDELLLDLVTEDQKFTLAKGGKGGAGNFCFKNSINQSPKNAISGLKGEEKWLKLKLKLIADVGLIGLPNVGKSTFLSNSTNTKPKIADYPFTTLEPNLGIAECNDQDFLIADIPGIIEDAFEGKGLGKKFLKHIERCKIFIHFIDAADPNVISNYSVVIRELKKYNASLLERKMITVLTKCDLKDITEINSLIDELNKINNDIEIYTVSFSKGVKNVLNALSEFLKQEDANKQQVYIYDPAK
ncbi:GTPase ObgE [Anaplasmataceae bacterium AB001_6]|nr:GTPase ObgE [Anaplasmataceae bacterium AB001_6]